MFSIGPAVVFVVDAELSVPCALFVILDKVATYISSALSLISVVSKTISAHVCLLPCFDGHCEFFQVGYAPFQHFIHMV